MSRKKQGAGSAGTVREVKVEYQRGRGHERKGDWRKAANAFGRGRRMLNRLDPPSGEERDLRARLCLGEADCLMRLGQTGGVRMLYDEVLRSRGEALEELHVRANLGMASFLMDEAQGTAWEYLERAEHPGSEGCRGDIARVKGALLRRKGDLEGALRELTDARSRIGPRAREGSRVPGYTLEGIDEDLVDVFEGLGRYREAIERMDRVEKAIFTLGPKEAPSSEHLARRVAFIDTSTRLHARAGDLRESVELCDVLERHLELLSVLDPSGTSHTISTVSNHARKTVLLLASEDHRGCLDAIRQYRDEVVETVDGPLTFSDRLTYWATLLGDTSIEGVLGMLHDDDALGGLMRDRSVRRYRAAVEDDDLPGVLDSLETLFIDLEDNMEDLLGNDSPGRRGRELARIQGVDTDRWYSQGFDDLFHQMVNLDIDAGVGTLPEIYLRETGDVLDGLARDLLGSLMTSRQIFGLVEDRGERGSVVVRDELEGRRFVLHNSWLFNEVAFGERIFLRVITHGGIDLCCTSIIRFHEDVVGKYLQDIARMGSDDTNQERSLWVLGYIASRVRT